MKRKVKNNSGVKMNSSTTGSLNNLKLEEPLICDENKYTLSQFQKYMKDKDAESSIQKF